MVKQRINRILSLAGITSRRKADELISEGRVTLNGNIVKDMGIRAVWGEDSIMVDLKEIQGPSERFCLMLNKPFGYISSQKDPEGRPLAIDLLKTFPHRVYSVGRLDFDSLGLLLFTNDGELSYRLSHPKYHIPKTYKVTLNSAITDEALESLRKGVELDDGFCRASKVVLLERNQGKSLIRITITRGANRIIRRMTKAIGYMVIHLIRTGFGNLELGRLKTGKYRLLDPGEISALKKMVGLD
ncbi:MAG: rRNA pseudouridine synthase [Deltaproteobacteria bacterium]|nr:rRNA pseudouridine synthase [Deltaproteobacteria bacterium]